jgi:protein-L-isoaspartate(D-aspartate) O-methyltransferase
MKIPIVFWLVFILITGCKAMKTKKTPSMEEQFQELRYGMVENQIRGRGITDKNILTALRKVPRHKFVPTQLQDQAYRDEPLPIGENQTISQPYIVAYMSDQLDLKPHFKVLEIGTGSGYQAAILAELCDSVFTIEIIPELSKRAQTVIKALGYENIYFKIGDGYQGWVEKSPFDAIIVTAAPDHIPQPLVDQLATNGKMIIPVGDFFQDLILIQKTGRDITKEKKIPVRFVPMRGKAEEKE